jgi:hypothetical protein
LKASQALVESLPRTRIRRRKQAEDIGNEATKKLRAQLITYKRLPSKTFAQQPRHSLPSSL